MQHPLWHVAIAISVLRGRRRFHSLTALLVVSQVTPLADANKAEPCDAVVQSIQFHPNGQLLLTAGLDKRLRLFNVRCRLSPAFHAFDMRLS